MSWERSATARIWKSFLRLSFNFFALLISALTPFFTSSSLHTQLSRKFEKEGQTRSLTFPQCLRAMSAYFSFLHDKEKELRVKNTTIGPPIVCAQFNPGDFFFRRKGLDDNRSLSNRPAQKRALLRARARLTPMLEGWYNYYVS